MARVNRLSRTESRAQTRVRLVAAARTAFLAHGFHGASLADIAEDAGYSVGALYSNFAGKAALFLAVFEDYVAERARELEAAVAGAPSSHSRPASVADQWMGKLAAEPEWFPLFAEFAGHAARDPELRQRFGASLGALRVAGGRLIARYGGGYALSDEELATAIKALGNGLALERMIDPAAVPDDLFARFLTMFFDGIEPGAGKAHRELRA